MKTSLHRKPSVGVKYYFADKNFCCRVWAETKIHKDCAIVFRLSISIVISILSSDTICQLIQFHTNSEAAMLSRGRCRCFAFYANFRPLTLTQGVFTQILKTKSVNSWSLFVKRCGNWRKKGSCNLMRSNYMQIFSRVECHCWWKLDEEKQMIAFLFNLPSPIIS